MIRSAAASDSGVLRWFKPVPMAEWECMAGTLDCNGGSLSAIPPDDLCPRNSSDSSNDSTPRSSSSRSSESSDSESVGGNMDETETPTYNEKDAYDDDQEDMTNQAQRKAMGWVRGSLRSSTSFHYIMLISTFDMALFTFRFQTRPDVSSKSD